MKYRESVKKRCVNIIITLLYMPPQNQIVEMKARNMNWLKCRLMLYKTWGPHMRIVALRNKHSLKFTILRNIEGVKCMGYHGDTVT